MTWQQWVQRLRSVCGLPQRAPVRTRIRRSSSAALIESLEDRQLLTVNFLFDYSLDTQGFFSQPQARDLLEQAAATLGSRLSDSLEAIYPAGINQWGAQFANPATGGYVSVSNLTVAADTLLIFVGARDLSGGTVAEGAPGGYSGNGTDEWLETLAARGQTGALVSGSQMASDFGPWGGSLTFDSSGTDWYFGTSIHQIGAQQMDFLSVAMHELGHILGFGTAESFDRYVAGSSFIGPNARAAFDGLGEPLLSGDRAHWMAGTQDGGQGAAMAPQLPTGTRRLFTGLDYAALRDVGWNLGGGQSGNPGVPTSTGGILVTAATGLQTTELGGSTSFNVRLSSQPRSPVTIQISSSNINEGNPSVRSVTFTTHDWNRPQTVVVTGVDDLILDGDQSYRIILSPAISTDSRFQGVDPVDVTITNIDNDQAAIVVTPTSGLITTEQGGTSSFTVGLTSEPTASVTINVTSSNTQEGTVSLTSLVFTPQNWMFPQTVVVKGVDDNVLDSNKLYAIILSTAVSGDSAYGGINPPDVSVMNISIPDLNPGIALSGTELEIWSNDMPVLLDKQVQINDPDSPFLNITGAQLVVAIRSNGTSNDRLSILHQGAGSGQVGNASGSSNVTYQGVVIGVRSGGTGTTPLVITFNSKATLAMVQRVARVLQIRTSSSNKSSLDRIVTLQFHMPDGTASNQATKVVHVITGATAPVINVGSGAFDYTNGSGPQLINPTASLVDQDSLTFGGGKLTVSLIDGAAFGDVLKIRRQGTGSAQIDAAQDGTVRFGRTIIGTWSGGTNGRALVITFKSTASVSAVQALIRNILFETAATNTSLASRTVQYQVDDGDGGVSAAVTKLIHVV